MFEPTDDCGKVEVTEVADMDAETTCETLCTASDANPVNDDAKKRCRFWRWENHHGVHPRKICYLMVEGMCQYPELCTGESCSGGDVGCQGGVDPTPPSPCKGPVVYDKDSIHWFCFHSEYDSLNAYHDADFPDGTTCRTFERCQDWANIDDGQETTNALWRKLQVNCEDGIWVKDPNGGGNHNGVEGEDDYDNIVISNGGKDAIVEPKCTGDALVTVPEGNIGSNAGAELICDTPVTPAKGNYVITAPNKCILLCDYHLVLTFKSEVNEKGIVGFYFDDAEHTSVASVTVDDVIKCW